MGFRLLICAGGSGGGVYPALSVYQELEDELDAVLWVGGIGGMEEKLVERARIPFEAIPAAGVHGVGIAALPVNLIRISRGYFAARRIIHAFRPDVMFFTGGYVSGPVALAGRQIPTLLYVPDIEPGLALKILARFADHVTLIAEDSRKYFQEDAKDDLRVTVTGHPVRKNLTAWTRVQALEMLSLSPNWQTLLVFGGSKGARSINRAVLSLLPELLKVVQVIHISGSLDWPEVQAAKQELSLELSERYKAFPYLHENMGAAYAAADLVLSRAGASAIGEFPLFKLPAILIPYPHAWRYQRVNAEYLARHGAAVIVDDTSLHAELLPMVQHLLRDAETRDRMQAAMASIARPQAANRIAFHLKELVLN